MKHPDKSPCPLQSATKIYLCQMMVSVTECDRENAGKKGGQKGVGGDKGLQPPVLNG